MDENSTPLTEPPNPGSCGSCKLCCTVMGVDFDNGQHKPEMVTCEHLCSAGCSIYEQRPQSCRGYECVWLASQRWPELAWPMTERPDRTNVVINGNSKATLIVHCKTPQAWRDPRVLKRMNQQIAKGAVVTIEHGNGDVSVYERDGSVTPMHFIGLDPVSNEKMYRRNR